MDIKKSFEAAAEKLKGAKYVLLVLLLGVVLLLLPTGGDKKTGEGENAAVDPQNAERPERELEARLEEILSLVDGAGEVRVLLTLSTDGERVLARDTETSSEDRDGEGRSETSESAVIVSRSGGGSEAVEVSYNYPSYRGAVVAAEGAGDPRVKLNLLEAVKAATGLSGERIVVCRLGGGK